MTGPLLDVVADDVGQFLAEDQALLQVLFHLKIQEIENLKIDQVLICYDYQIL